jgi:hypothetical protein
MAMRSIQPRINSSETPIPMKQEMVQEALTASTSNDNRIGIDVEPDS